MVAEDLTHRNSGRADPRVVSLLLVVFCVVSALPVAEAATPGGPVYRSLRGATTGGTTGVVSPAGLAITTFLADPATVVKGNVTYLNVSISGGTPPYSFAYSGLPYPCLSKNLSSLTCRPDEVRAFDVTVVVTDGNGSSAQSVTPLDVLSGFSGPPSVSSFYARPSSVDVGQVTYLWTNATSTSEPSFLLSISYFGLPPGCASFNQSPLECLPTASGNFTIVVRVTDGFGQFTQTTSHLTVTGGASSASTRAPAVPWLPLGVVGVVVIAAVVVAAVWRRRRRVPPSPRRGDTEGSAGSGPVRGA